MSAVPRSSDTDIARSQLVAPVRFVLGVALRRSLACLLRDQVRSGDAVA